MADPRPLGDAEVHAIVNEAFSFGQLAAQVQHLVRAMDEKNADEAQWRAQIMPILLERSGDRQMVERIRSDMNGLGDKVRKLTDTIERIERERAEQLQRIERDGTLRVEELERAQAVRVQTLEKEHRENFEALSKAQAEQRADLRRYLAFGAGAFFALQGFWVLFGDGLREALKLGGN